MADLLPMRRLGSGVTHLVPIMPESIGTGRLINDFRGTEALVVSVCLAKLNGPKAWMQNGSICRGCQRTADRYGHTVRWFDPDSDLPESTRNGSTSEVPS